MDKIPPYKPAAKGKVLMLNPASHADTGIAKTSYEVDGLTPNTRVRGLSYYRCTGISLTIWDCSRKITLDFGLFESQKRARLREVKQRKLKLSKLRALLDDIDVVLDQEEQFIEENY